MPPSTTRVNVATIGVPIAPGRQSSNLLAFLESADLWMLGRGRNLTNKRVNQLQNECEFKGAKNELRGRLPRGTGSLLSARYLRE